MLLLVPCCSPVMIMKPKIPVSHNSSLISPHTSNSIMLVKC